jgi:ankyrin repeat protein
MQISENSPAWVGFQILASQPEGPWEVLPLNPIFDQNAAPYHRQFRWAIDNEHTPLLRLLLDITSRGFKKLWGRRGVSGGSLLQVAAKHGRVTVTQFLLGERINTNFKDDTGRTALSWAAGNGHELVVKLLLAKNDVDVNLKDRNKRAALSWAVMGGHEGVVKLLLAKDGIDVNLRTYSGYSALSLAAQSGREAVVKLLRDSGAEY